MANLIDNGRFYGGGVVEVSVEPAPVVEGEVAEHVWIVVEDHGPGVPADERKLIFGRFARGSGGAPQPG